jgi:uncharacterized MAPEG superfamily protein
MTLPVPLILLASIAAAAVLIYVPYGAVAYGRFQVGMDFGAPRALFDKLPGFAKRATWAHQNSFETFTPFAAAALMAYATGVTAPSAGIAAIAFVVSRFLFSLFYILNLPPLRSLMFGVGSAATVSLFYQSLLKASQGLG